MSYYSQTQTNPIKVDGTTNANPTDNIQKVPFPINYSSVNTIRIDYPHQQNSQSIDGDLQERELDPKVDKTLTDNNFKALSGM